MGAMKPLTPLTSTAAKPVEAREVRRRDTPSVREPQPHREQTDQVDLGEHQLAAPTVDERTVAEQPAPERTAVDSPQRTTLQMEETAPVTQDETNWVLESGRNSAYGGTPEMEAILRRFPSLPGEVKSELTMPLLDALTQSDQTQGVEKLRDVDLTVGWAQKFKKDAKATAGEGYEAMLAAARAAEGGEKPVSAGPLDQVLASPGLVFSSELDAARTQEANHLLEQFAQGNTNPGIGTKALERGVSYLRGRKGTRIFYKMQEGKPQWLAVCDKSTEQKAINRVQEAVR